MFIRKRDEMRGVSSILSLFRNEFNKFTNTGARMLDSIYHMTIHYLEITFWCEKIKILPLLCSVRMDFITLRD